MALTFDLVLWNTVAAAALAVLALASGCARRPAVTHALWILVLVRLLVPTAWTWDWPQWPETHGGAVIPQAEPMARAFDVPSGIDLEPVEAEPPPFEVLLP